MDNIKSNDLLMSVIKRVALQAKIEGGEALGFKKRKVLLDQLSEAKPDAWKVTNELVETQLRVDRIIADKEKEQKNPEVWKAELEVATANRQEAGATAAAYYKAQGISLEGLETLFSA